ncbi:MAG: hypothetical protein KC731_28900, partial [Myxococcales bacterium]|nr:hypothetical protein [Myxococcales bacterium]
MFFASGVSGLLYQVVWVRQLGQVVGNTLYAVALVTSVFMGGLGVGSYLAGRFVDRRPPAEGLRLYGLAELGIGGAGVGLALLLPRLSGLSASLASYRQGPEGWQVLSTGTWAFHYLVVIATLAAPCLLMGATLTLLIRYLVGTQLSSAGFRVGLLYGANTAGAALGALCSDFALIPAVGIARTQLLAVALNVIAGGAALWLCRGGAAAPTRVDATEPDVALEAPLPWLIPGTALALLLAGFAAMGLEVVWFRYLAQLLGSLRATFSLLLAVMLVAMWLGAMAGGWLHRRYGHARLLFVVSQIALLVLVALLLGAVDLEHSQLAFRDEMRADFARATDGARPVIEVWSSLRPILMMVMLPAFLMGAVFPIANGHAQRASATVGGRAGLLYLATTLGNVLGSSLTGFVLIPMLGIRVAVWVLLGCVVASVVPMYLSGRPAEAPARDDRAFLAALGTGLVATVAFGLS